MHGGPLARVHVAEQSSRLQPASGFLQFSRRGGGHQTTRREHAPRPSAPAKRTMQKAGLSGSLLQTPGTPGLPA